MHSQCVCVRERAIRRVLATNPIEITSRRKLTVERTDNIITSKFMLMMTSMWKRMRMIMNELELIFFHFQAKQ